MRDGIRTVVDVIIVIFWIVAMLAFMVYVAGSLGLMNQCDWQELDLNGKNILVQVCE